MEIQDLLQWLENTDLRLSSTRTVWGMPDSANERLNAHLVRLICLIIQYITISASLGRNKYFSFFFFLPQICINKHLKYHHPINNKG